MDNKKSAAERFKEKMASVELEKEITSKLRDHIENYSQPMVVTLANGYSFSVTGFSGTFTGIGPTEEDFNLTTILGDYNLEDLMKLGMFHSDSIKEAISQLIQKDPVAALGVMVNYKDYE